MNTLTARSGIVPEPIARQPWEMLIPLVLLGITAAFCGVIWWSYMGVSIDSLMGNTV